MVLWLLPHRNEQACTYKPFHPTAARERIEMNVQGYGLAAASDRLCSARRVQ